MSLVRPFRPGRQLRHVRSWQKLTQHPQPIRWSTETCLAGVAGCRVGNLRDQMFRPKPPG